eukprot:COSAG02_NODE_108_length_36286_cov_19.437478_8_plen_62_part_00
MTLQQVAFCCFRHSWGTDTDDRGAACGARPSTVAALYRVVVSAGSPFPSAYVLPMQLVTEP